MLLVQTKYIAGYLKILCYYIMNSQSRLKQEAASFKREKMKKIRQKLYDMEKNDPEEFNKYYTKAELPTEHGFFSFGDGQEYTMDEMRKAHALGFTSREIPGARQDVYVDVMEQATGDGIDEGSVKEDLTDDLYQTGPSVFGGRMIKRKKTKRRISRSKKRKTRKSNKIRKTRKSKKRKSKKKH